MNEQAAADKGELRWTCPRCGVTHMGPKAEAETRDLSGRTALQAQLEADAAKWRAMEDAGGQYATMCADAARFRWLAEQVAKEGADYSLFAENAGAWTGHVFLMDMSGRVKDDPPKAHGGTLAEAVDQARCAK